MTETNARASQTLLSRGCLVALIALSVFVGFLVVGIPYLREQQKISFERQKAEWRQDAFERVKNGDTRVSIMDSKLLPKLARDADCVANLTELSFSMTEITADDAAFIAQLKNVHSLYFYDTHGAERVLENSRDLPIKKLGFEMDRLSKDSLRKLPEFPELREVYFEHVMYPNEIAILETYPPRINVRIPYPAENEPGFKERGEPADAPESASRGF
jgi:hypothetical protein